MIGQSLLYHANQQFRSEKKYDYTARASGVRVSHTGYTVLSFLKLFGYMAPVPNGNWPIYFSFYFPPFSRTFSVPKSIITISVLCFHVKMGFQRESFLQPPTPRSTNLRHCYILLNLKKLNLIKIHYICRTKPKMKSSGLFTELFQWTKNWAGEIPAYGGKNKSGLMAEKKPAYGQIINYGQLLL